MGKTTGGAAARARRGASAPGATAPGDVSLPSLALGIDVGGTGVKAAIVDLRTAELVSSRIREKTPQPSTPEAVIDTIASVVSSVLAEHGPVEGLPMGCGLPGPIKAGVMKTAANLDAGWVDFDAGRHISRKLGTTVHIINDADAAGMAELAFGEAAGRSGTTILLTIGTGIGSALISEGRLVPNTEFGHLEMRGKGAEKRVSGAARTRRGIGWKKWAREFNEYLAMLDLYFWPDTIILGGGVSKDSAKYESNLESRAAIVKARFLNTSGIIGAAYAAGLAAAERDASAGSTRRAATRRRSSGGSASRASAGRRSRG